MSPAKYVVRTSYLLQKSNVAIYVEQRSMEIILLVNQSKQIISVKKTAITMSEVMPQKSLRGVFQLAFRCQI